MAKKTFLVNGRERTAVCNKCWSCRLKRHSDWLGRALAEAETADHVRLVTLTYASDARVTAQFDNTRPDGEVSEAFKASSIVKRDIQLYFKRLRKDFSVRYIAAAEFGSKKGRVHWHCILYFYGDCPDIPLRERLYGGDKYWKHGIVYWDKFSSKGAYYALKYVMKPAKVDHKLLKHERVRVQDIQAMQWATRSDTPPMGIEYFRRRAREMAKQGVAMRDLTYSFSHVRERGEQGKPKKFWLLYGSACATAYIREYISEWERIRPSSPVPFVGPVERFLDDRASLDAGILSRTFRKVSEPFFQPDGAERRTGELLRASFDERLNTWVAVVDGKRLLWSFDEIGERAWASNLVVPSEAQRRRLAAGSGQSQADAYAEASAARGWPVRR